MIIWKPAILLGCINDIRRILDDVSVVPRSRMSLKNRAGHRWCSVFGNFHSVTPFSRRSQRRRRRRERRGHCFQYIHALTPRGLYSGYVTASTVTSTWKCRHAVPTDIYQVLYTSFFLFCSLFTATRIALLFNYWYRSTLFVVTYQQRSSPIFTNAFMNFTSFTRVVLTTHNRRMFLVFVEFFL